MKGWEVFLISFAVAAVVTTVAVLIYWAVTRNASSSSSSASSSQADVASVVIITTASGPYNDPEGVTMTLKRSNGQVVCSFTAVEGTSTSSDHILIDSKLDVLD